MIFGLGFLLATLAALLIVPALNARADRLARRRIEAQFPLSISELNAEKDHLRAEFAVLQRRIEIKADEAQAAKQSVMEELGRRVAEVEHLGADLTERKQQIAAMEAGLSEARAGFEAATAELATVSTDLAATREALASLDEAHRTTVSELASDRLRLEKTTADLGRIAADLDLTRTTLADREASLADLQTRHKAALAENDARRITISDLENRLASLTIHAKELDRSLAARRIELAAEQHRGTEMARSLLAEQERGVALEARNRALEAERGTRTDAVAASAAALAEARAAREAAEAEIKTRLGEIEAGRHDLEEARARITALELRESGRDREQAAAMRRLEEQVEVLKAEKAAIEGALAAARKERSRSDAELKTLRRGTEASSAAVRTENADLRRRIDELAEVILAMGEAGDLPDRPAPADQPAAALESGTRARRAARG